MPVGSGLKEGWGGERDGTGGKLKTEIGLLCRPMTRYSFGKRGEGEGAYTQCHGHPNTCFCLVVVCFCFALLLFCFCFLCALFVCLFICCCFVF